MSFLEVKNVKKYFNTKNGLLHAVDDVSFSVPKGQTLGLVGESGCGKSTVGRTIIRLLEANAGSIYIDDVDVRGLSPAELKKFRKRMQIVFQDPFSSLNPRLSISEAIAEFLIVHKEFSNKKDMENRVLELMDLVGIERRLMNAYPHELDGGMRQRVGIARTLSLNPDFIVLDEPVSALDVCIQAQILNLLMNLQDKLGLTYLFISHDLSVVKHISDRIAVMYLGKIVELSDHNEIFRNPAHPYTKALLSAIPIPKLHQPRERIILAGDVPSPINPPAGCRFAGRCPNAFERCFKEEPHLREVGNNTEVACHLYADCLVAAQH